MRADHKPQAVVVSLGSVLLKELFSVGFSPAMLLKCLSQMEKELQIGGRKAIPKDIRESRLSFNNQCVKRERDVLLNWGSPFEPREDLINLTSGIAAPEVVVHDLLEAQNIGENAYQKFLADRIQSTSVLFYDPIKRFGLKTFTNMTIKKTIRLKERFISIAAERSIFGRLLVVGKNRDGLSLKNHVLSYSLSPIP
jgi:hypothetical protein